MIKKGLILPLGLLVIILVIVYFTEGRQSLKNIAREVKNTFKGGVMKLQGYSKTSFLNLQELTNTIKPLLKKYDWDYVFPLAVICLEVDYGKACYEYNLFNITTLSNEPKKYFQFPSIKELKFRRYSSYAESVQAFYDLISGATGMTIYKECFNNRHNGKLALQYMINAGYAGAGITPDRYLKVYDYLKSLGV